MRPNVSYYKNMENVLSHICFTMRNRYFWRWPDVWRWGVPFSQVFLRKIKIARFLLLIIQ